MKIVPLPLSATIPPGMTARVVARLRVAFRPERLFVSPSSFPLPLVRRVWTWPLVVAGGALGRVYRGLARLLRVDLHATHERREYVSVAYAQAHAEEVSWEYTYEDEDEDEDEGEDEGRPFVLVPTPLRRRERLIALLGRLSGRLSRVRLDWQQAQLGDLFVCAIAVSGSPQLAQGVAPLPVDLFASRQVDTFVSFHTTCLAGREIEVEIYNGNLRVCQFTAALIGTARDE